MEGAYISRAISANFSKSKYPTKPLTQKGSENTQQTMFEKFQRMMTRVNANFTDKE